MKIGVRSSYQHRWIPQAVTVAVVYGLVGTGFAAGAGSSTSVEMRMLWRWTAWLVSIVVFVTHVGYERFRRTESPARGAFHSAFAAAGGAFVLAAAAFVHSLGVASPGGKSISVALLVWPALTGVPAFLVAYALSTALARIRRRTVPPPGNGSP